MPGPEPDNYKRLDVAQNALYQEQNFYWLRFTAFATLHAGLFVIATSIDQGRWIGGLLVALLGLLLSAIWVKIQLLSLDYVDRWKPIFHAERRQLGFEFTDEKPNTHNHSSTDLAMLVPWAICGAWVIIILFLVLPF